MLLRDWRKRNKVTLQEFAEMVGLKSAASILAYERSTIPKPYMLERIEKATKGKVKTKDFYKKDK